MPFVLLRMVRANQGDTKRSKGNSLWFDLVALVLREDYRAERLHQKSLTTKTRRHKGAQASSFGAWWSIRYALPLPLPLLFQVRAEIFTQTTRIFLYAKIQAPCNRFGRRITARDLHSVLLGE